MKATCKTRIGQAEYTFEFEEREEMETLHKIAVLSNPRSKCNECGEYGMQSKVLDSNKDKEGNIYINVVCTKCGAKSKLGQYKAGGWFWHEYKKWEGKKEE